MLKPVAKSKTCAPGVRFAIVASEYNDKYVDSMLRAAKRVLREAGAEEVRVVRVPGAFEIPLAAERLAAGGYRALICLGVVIRGETAHAQLIGEAVTAALMQLQLRYAVPVIHEVLLLENEAQAAKRCLDPLHNRGGEAAQTAVAMARLMPRL